MARGGARKGAGRPKTDRPPVEANKRTAEQVLALLKRPIHDVACKCYLCVGWYWLHSDEVDLKLRWDAWKYYNDKAHGKAVQTVNHVHDKPLDVNVTLSLADKVQQARKRASEA